MPYPIALDSHQWARESSFGTDLAATSKILVERMNYTAGSEFARPTVARGLLQRNRGYETPVKRWSNWSAEGPVSYEQLQNWLCMIEDVASPTGAGPYVWAHTMNPAAVPAPASFTFERRVTDGTTPIVHAWHGAMMQSLELTGADGELLRFAANGFARRIQTGEAITAALSLPTPELAPTALAGLYINDTWAAIGSTQVASQILGFSVRVNTGYAPTWTLDARSDLDYTTYLVNPAERSIEATITCFLGAQYATERAAAQAGTLRAVRLSIAGTSSRALTIDFLAKYDRPELFEFGDQDGQHSVTLSLVESTDGTNLAKFSLTNNVSAFA